ncbi:magnesium transporter [Stutzerimonas nitrititolerans]|uniref:Magnesium transporter MgtE n=2 Tax=Stutzerimonas nitrititolerans TaxID=2482751 RepID=A0AA42BCZ4_9GAMM|nr:magnesium transporter [Stutzerimonas nitrititolerans]AFN77332.1 magnesium transporter [Stutzerimonas stutzeri DSM 10701]KRW74013.1 magnesium transporter [Pseudomonas sp. TTU2014-066ASC]KRW74962.1 magnesium transporter [Pseudomonas sp. TTU2014-096BSC]MBA1185066.1 magnesium transporter [Stutzerimonas stutzeri]OCX19348.1 magnesium transporter [Stutzerimonas xanthomarina]RRV24820.1 magnesium transporter [Pseudomonas sp. s199]WAD27857.1 magnesium transporter [Pseudomonadaceae bacterium T75]HA
MTEVEAKKPQESLQDRLAQVVELLHRHRLVEDLAHRQEGQHQERVENLVHRQNLVELQRKLEVLHPADVAHILEALPLDDRLTVWQLVKSERDGDILLEVSDAVRETLIADMDDHEILAAAKDLDADELADLAAELPRDVVHELMETLDAQQRERVRSALSYEEDQVGALMDFEMVTIREDVSLEVVLRYLRRLKELPGHTDKLFVVDYDGVLKGVLPIKRLLVNDPEKQVAEVMASDPVTFHPDEDAYEAAQAFERYDLVSTPVVDKSGKLIGRLTIDEMVDLIREESESEVLSMAGLREEEDIFASVWKSLRNRWAWLAVNLVTAFVASRVIGLFDGSIEKLVALAALMPIVAGIGGNSGNQTITMIVRAMALDQIGTGNSTRLLRKEAGVGLLNGLIWGGVIGLVVYWLYDSWSLGLVMTAAMTLNLLLAALMGVLIPMTLARLGRDPALGSSVMITAMTDSGGFFIFLGLATVFLL